MDYDKPFKSFKELALCLQNEHGLMVDDVNQAAYILQFLPYYDLVNGYKEIFRQMIGKLKKSGFAALPPMWICTPASYRQVRSHHFDEVAKMGKVVIAKMQQPLCSAI